jgi:hypothetical protein
MSAITYTKLIDCQNKDKYDVLSIIQGLLYYEELDSQGKPIIKIRTK